MDTCERKTLTSEEEKKLTRFIATCYEALNIYGKSPEQLEAITMLMQITLKDQPYNLIRRGFEKHIRQSSVMPTPHDILNAISMIKLEDMCEATRLSRLNGAQKCITTNS